MIFIKAVHVIFHRIKLTTANNKIKKWSSSDTNTLYYVLCLFSQNTP